MIYVLAIALIVQPAIFLFHLDRVSNRHEGQVRDLLLRIQDPVAAVAQQVIGEYPVAHLPFDDDGAWLAHVEELNETR